MHTILSKILLTAVIVISGASPLFAQPSGPNNAASDLPTDYLTKEFHAGRRAALRAVVPANSVVAVFSFPTRNYSNDVDYLYHQNPDLYYFTGYKEPHSMLLVFKEPQVDSAGN